MAPPKRASPLDEPPAASSSEEAEQASSEEEEDDEEDDPSEDESEKAVKKAPASVSKPQDSDSESDSSSDSEPDDSAVKPISSKPMEDSSTAAAAAAASPAAKSKRPRSKPAAAPAKRQAESEPAKAGSKRAKKKSSDGEDNASAAAVAAGEDGEPKKLGGGGDEKKLFQRLWSEEDEIVILKGMIDYASKKGSFPSTDMSAFHDFVKKSLHMDFTKSQLTDKVRRLRKKYENNSAKKKYDPSKPHEKKAFELSQKIWSRADEPRSNGTAVRTAPRSNGKSLALRKPELISSPEPSKEAEKMVVDAIGGGLESEIFGFDKSFPEYILKQGLGLVSEEKKAELEAKWKKLRVAELELFVKRTQLLSEQGQLILDALKSSDG